MPANRGERIEARGGIRSWVAGLHRRDADAADQTRRELTAIETEYDSYTKRMQRMLGHGALVTVVSLLFIWVLTFAASPNSSTPAFEILLMPLTGGITLGIFGALAAVVIGVQLAVRTSVSSLPQPADRARRRFLSRFAMLLVVVSLAFGCYASVPALSRFPSLDVVGIFGPLMGGLGLAVLAADATMADAEEPHHALRESVESEARRREFRRRVSVLAMGTRAPRGRRLATEAGVAILMPLGLGAAFAYVGLDASPRALTVALVLSCVTASLGYYAVWDVYRASMRNSWSFLAPTVLFAPLVAATSCLYAVSASLQFGANSLRDVSVSLLFGILSFVAPSGLAVALLGPHRGGATRGLLRQLMLRGEVRLWLRASRRASIARTPWNKLAIAAIATFWLFPFGIVLGLAAQRQIELVGRNQEGAPAQRGSGLVRAAWYMGWASLLIPLAVLIAFAITNPR